MKQFAILLTVFAALHLSACSSESSFPVATGKANIRALNAVKTAPDVVFLIEERSLGQVGYRQITPTSRYDDLNYNFNFDVSYAGERALVRVASTAVDIVKDMDYVFVLTGSLAEADILVWESAEREFSSGDTVFEARFAHTAETLGSVDYYFAPPGVDPVAGEEAGTLTFGEVLPSIDYEEGDYVLTITENGAPDQVLYESGATTFAGTTQYIITSFDGDDTSFAPYIARAITSASGSVSGSITMPDANYPPTTEFVNGSLALGTVDIYADELLSSQIVTGHAYRDVSAELEISSGDNPVFYTPTTLLSPVLIESEFGFFGSLRGRVVAYGPADTLAIRPYLPDRRSVETQAKLQIFNAAINFDALSIYVVEADETIEDKIPVRPILPTGNAAQTIGLAEGRFDIFVTQTAEDEILAGPIRINVDYGDVLGGIIFDTDDPAVLELDFLPTDP